MTYLLCAALTALLGRAAWSDIVRRRIPNAVVGGIGLLWVPHALSLDPATAMASAGLAATTLAVGVAAWQAGWLGAGDAKLVAALGLWSGPEGLLPMLLVIALCGGMVAGLILLRRPLRRVASALVAGASWRIFAACAEPVPGTPAGAGTTSVPYGVAIAGGGLFVVHGLLAG
jgi:prepilin peptidase CpaA